MIYLATPYSDASPNVMSARFVLACKVAGELLDRGEVVFSPIAHGHPISLYSGAARDWRFWANSCREMIGLASKVIVVRMPGWDKSKGVAAEIAIALELGKPVEYMDLEGAGE